MTIAIQTSMISDYAYDMADVPTPQPEPEPEPVITQLSMLGDPPEIPGEAQLFGALL